MIYFFIFCTVFLVFRQWFLPGFITAGDFSGITQSAIEQVSIFPTLWSSVFENSLGSSTISYVWNHFPYTFPMFVFGKLMHISPGAVVRIGYLYPFLFFGFIGTYTFAKKYVSPSWAWLSGLLYTVNTYSLMIIGGGQIGIALAYSFAPLIFYSYLNLYENIKLKYSLLFGILFGILVMFDLRIAYITLFALGIYFIFHLKLLIISKNLKEIVINISYLFTFPLVVSGLLHAFWILPLLIFHQNPSQSIGAVYTSLAAVKFFSFADFSHALSLLHPNWPENLFGKTYFLQTEFLVLPLLAFSSLLYSRKNTNVHFFVLLGLIGVFLAKGANPPFGDIYLWLFERVPGFIMFRDPTKFYLLIAFSYAVLIPYALEQFVIWIRMKIQELRILVNIVLITLFIIFWFFTIREAVLGKLGGTFQARQVPVEYFTLKDYLVAREGFSRVLWVPSRQRYGFYSDDKPGLSLEAFGIASPSSFISWIRDPESEEQLKRYAVSDIVVPTDPLGELFVTDRKYDDKKRVSIVAALRVDPDVREISGFGDIAVFQNKGSYGHAYFTDAPSEPLDIQRITPTEYNLVLPSLDQTRSLVFSESYDPYWELEIGTQHLLPKKTPDGIQEYQIEAFSGGRVHLRYRPQQLVYYGLIISGLTFVLINGYFLYGTVIGRKRVRV